MSNDHHETDTGPDKARCDSRQRTVAAIALAAALLVGGGLLAAALLAPPRSAAQQPVPSPSPPPPPPPPPVLSDRDREGGTGGLNEGTGRAREGDGSGAGRTGERTGYAGKTIDDAPAGSPDTVPGPTNDGTGTGEKPAEVPSFGFTVDKPEESPAAPVGVPEANDGEGKAGKGTEFLGLTTKARTVVFVLDYSSSMRGDSAQDEERIEQDKTVQLRRAVAKCMATLPRGTQFTILLFGGCVKAGVPYTPKFVPKGNGGGRREHANKEDSDPGATVCLSDGKDAGSGAVTLKDGSRAARDEAIKWLADREPHPEGTSRPEPAMRRALLAKPLAVFLLTDGEFDPKESAALLATIAELNAGKQAEIHTIAFGSEGDIAVLRQIADDNRGQYAHIPIGP